MDYLTKSSKILNRAIAILIILLGISLNEQGKLPAILAQTEKPNPLESPQGDPLLPTLTRPLTLLEQRRIREATVELNNQANTLLQSGDAEGAFQLWYRELRLQRALGRLEEIQALGRVGGIAWENNRSADVQLIAQRLITIQQQAQVESPLDPVLLNAFGQAYLQVHSINEALAIHQQILANARQKNDLVAQEATLKTIGQLHLARFHYPEAAAVYEELLLMARAQANAFNEGIYLQQLAEIYQQASQPQNSVRIKEQLVDNYLQNQQIQAIPNLKILIGSDYEALKQAEKASQNYQEAFALAWALQQLGAASEALSKLGDLYLSYEQDEYALQIYRELLKVEQRSYNYYGLMNTYDRMGKIYLEKKNYPQALTAFQKALEIAQSLSYREAYFRDKIQEVNAQNEDEEMRR